MDNLIILFTMNIKRTDDYALIPKIETLKKNKMYKKLNSNQKISFLHT